MLSDELRSAYLHFFESKGHLIIPSSSLVPHGDPTLLLTTAGMVQIKPYFLGEAVPPKPRLTSSQKCFRTTDVDSVGDRTHLTFFEMLGNFSVGDYFKKEAISWAWEFVTQKLKLPPERLWITVFLDDDEAFSYWRKLGVPEERIIRMGEDTNFWGPAGDSGPCGPCSEIHYDFGKQVKCTREPCYPGCDCGRYSEIWNLVFTQYDQDKEGKRTSLPRPNIDTGMGLERVAAIVQGKESVYETDLFTPLIEKVCALSGKIYAGADEVTGKAIRVVAEHSRSVTFLIGDGVLPSNEGRGYVLRRVLRRATLFARRIGLDRPFLTETATVAIEKMRNVYPELEQRRDFILTVIDGEEKRFRETLNTGLELIEELIAHLDEQGAKQIPGVEAFRLYDTYGFPVEITQEIAAGRGLSVDIEGFKREMERQRERAKASARFDTAARKGKAEDLDVDVTLFVGYESMAEKAAILGILADNKPAQNIKKGDKADIILSRTPFYGEMGGQVGDTGEIRSATGLFTVTDTLRRGAEVIVHRGHVKDGTFSVGEGVEAEVDRERRLDIARNHTATHLLHAALREVVGEHVQQRGSLVSPDRLRFDYSHLVPLTHEQLSEVQSIVNARIRQNHPVHDEQRAYKEAVADGAMALFDEKYGDVVRVLKIGEPEISTELCGGTHVTGTGEIGFFQIISESSVGSGARRIEAVTGRGAERHVARLQEDLQQVGKMVGAAQDNIVEKVTSTLSALENEQKRAQSLERELARRTVESLVGQAEMVDGVKVLSARVPPVPMEILREMSDALREKLGSAILVLGTVYEDKPSFLAAVTDDLIAKGYSASDLVRKVARVTGGGGGGKANLAQAGGKDRAKLDEALGIVKNLVKENQRG